MSHHYLVLLGKPPIFKKNGSTAIAVKRGGTPKKRPRNSQMEPETQKHTTVLWRLLPEEDKGRGSRPPTAAHHHLSGAVWRSSFCSGRGGRRRRRRPPRTTRRRGRGATRRRGEEEEEGDEEEEDGHFLPTFQLLSGVDTFCRLFGIFFCSTASSCSSGVAGGLPAGGEALSSPSRPGRDDGRQPGFEFPGAPHQRPALGVSPLDLLC